MRDGLGKIGHYGCPKSHHKKNLKVSYLISDNCIQIVADSKEKSPDDRRNEGYKNQYAMGLVRCQFPYHGCKQEIRDKDTNCVEHMFYDKRIAFFVDERENEQTEEPQDKREEKR